jgi:branched-chain amino acid transport system substrate-binding protein
MSKSDRTTGSSTTTITRRTFSAGAAATAASLAVPLRSARAAQALKVGILLPRSGFEAQLGQDCQRGADIAPPLLKELGYPDLEYILGDTESSVQIARAQAEKMINEGVELLIGTFDSGQTTAVAQVAEQKGVPLVINIAAAPGITEQGYKYVFRNFPTGPMIVGDAFRNQKELFAVKGNVPKTMVMLHVNDTFGAGLSKAVKALTPRFKMPYELVDLIAYDPKARDLSVEVAKAKATRADALWVVSRLNDAILLTREMVKQRWEPTGILSTGPGWYDDQYLRAVGKWGDDVISLVPWYDPTKPLTKRLAAAFAKAYPDRTLNTNHVFTFEAVLTAADAFKRAGTTDPKALAAALRTTNITNNVNIGPGIQFNAKGQNDKVKNAGVQNRNGKPLVVLPRTAAAGDIIWPMRGWRQRG